MRAVAIGPDLDSSASGDSGADPNRVVEIVDDLAATTVTDKVTAESFHTLAGPTYGKVYRGVAYVPEAPHPRFPQRHGEPR